MSKQRKGIAKKEPKKKRKDAKVSLYKPEAANAMADFRYLLWAALDSPQAFYIIMKAITRYRESQGCFSTVTPKYIYTAIRILRQFTKNINFNGTCDLLFQAFENPANKEFNPYISQVAKKLGLSLTTVKEHLRAIIGAGLMEFEKIEGQRAKLKRLNPTFLDALDLLGHYETLVLAHADERNTLQKTFKESRQRWNKFVDKIIPKIPTPLLLIEPSMTILSAQDDSPDIPF